MRGVFGLLLIVAGGYVAFGIVTGRVSLPGSSSATASGPGLGTASSNVSGNPTTTGGIVSGIAGSWGGLAGTATQPNGRTSGGAA